MIEGLGGLMRALEESAALQSVAVDAAAGMAAIVVHNHVYDVFGDDQKLAPLAPATIAAREAKGDRGADWPLLIDGTLLRDSVESGSEGNLAGVGSSEPVMLYQEYGYLNHRTGKPVPARPVFKIGMIESESEVIALAEEAVGVSLGLIPRRLTVKE
jgi:phage gpG-like protein